MACGGNSSPEISVADLLSDPLIRLVMAADRVKPADIEHLFQELRGLASPRGVGQLQIAAETTPEYRPGVGVMLLNKRNRVFVGLRADISNEAWQMPQGGIEPGEEPLAAALRELREEIGTDHVEVQAESRGWLKYDLPPDLVGKAWNGRWRGQQQRWFAMRFIGEDAEINIATEHPEFSAWQWVHSSRIPDLIVPFKRGIYEEVLRAFGVVGAASTE